MLWIWGGVEGRGHWARLAQCLGQCITDPKQRKHKLPVAP